MRLSAALLAVFAYSPPLQASAPNAALPSCTPTTGNHVCSALVRTTNIPRPPPAMTTPSAALRAWPPCWSSAARLLANNRCCCSTVAISAWARLFHTVTRETGGELRLMTELGYDAATLGNHEFDFRPAGLAAMISSAHKIKGDALMPLLSSNLGFDPARSEDDSLQAHYEAGRIAPYKLIDKGGIRFGLFGLLGNNAVAVSPMIKPAVFADPVETAKAMVATLREEGAEVVILLSHMGVVQQADGSWRGEEVELVEQVPGIDIVVGGHSHTALAAACCWSTGARR